ncbi:MAG: GNAT family N-acetyltransferase [bacterium]|nr:GNAT family N-acetyltransferase [bacterium]
MKAVYLEFEKLIYKPSSIPYVICLNDPINTVHGISEYSIILGNKSEWNKGYAKEASLSIINYCFNKVGLRKITLAVQTNNKSAVHLYNKIGFNTEGTLKKQYIFKSVYYDTLRMTIFSPRFHNDNK